MNTDNMIEVTNLNLVDLVKKAYLLSKPQGMGFLHYMEGDELSDIEATNLIDYGNPCIAVSMDYVKGRSCKFAVFNNEGKLFIEDIWYDHSPEDLDKLLES